MMSVALINYKQYASPPPPPWTDFTSHSYLTRLYLTSVIDAFTIIILLSVQHQGFEHYAFDLLAPARGRSLQLHAVLCRGHRKEHINSLWLAIDRYIDRS